MKLDMVFVSWLIESVRLSRSPLAPSTSLLVPLNYFVAVTTYLENVVTRTGALAAASLNMCSVRCGHITEVNACV